MNRSGSNQGHDRMGSKLWTAARAAPILGAGISVIGLVSGRLYEQAQRAPPPLHSAVHEPQTIFSNGGPRPGCSWLPIQCALAVP